MLLNDLHILNKKVFIFGITETSLILSKFLMKYKVGIYIWDDNINLILKYKDNDEFKNQNIEFKPIKDIDDLLAIEYVVVCKDIIEEADVFKEIIDKFIVIQKNILTDVDFFYKLFPDNNFVGIIGDSGRSLICNLIRHVLDESKLNEVSFNKEEFLKDNNLEDIKNCICCLPIPLFKIDYLREIIFKTIIIYELKNEKEIAIIKKIISTTKVELTLILNISNNFIESLYQDLLKDKKLHINLVLISADKIENNCISCINGRIFDYSNNQNKNIDIKETDIIKGDFYHFACALSYAVSKRFNLTDEEIMDYIFTYKGVKDNLSRLRSIENMDFINNIGANSDVIFNTAYEIYDNIFSIVLVNDIKEENFHLKFFKNKSTFVFIVDLFGSLINIKDANNIYKFNNVKDAFIASYNIAKEEVKENKITVLLTAYCGKEVHSVYFKKEKREFIKLVQELKE